MALYGVIIAGGRGKRFWPQSTIKKPKYLLRLPGQKTTLLQQAACRLNGLVKNDNIFVITNKLQCADIKKQLPNLSKKNIIPEPLSKNSAPAIGVAAAIVKKRDPEAVIIVLPADQLIPNDSRIKSAFKKAALIAKEKNGLVTIGINPTYPATGFGYIKAGKKIKANAFKVSKFTEKPKLKKAKSFLKEKKYYWNSGIFIWKASVILKEIKRYAPKIAKNLELIEKGASLNKCYKNFPNISIDFAVMEKSKKVYVIKTNLKWQDMGSWKNLCDIIKTNSAANIVIGHHVSVNTKNSIIVGEKNHLIATAGLEDVVVVHTDKATLVCKREESEAIKDLVDKIEKKGLKEFL